MFSKTFYILLIFSLQFSSIEEKVFQNSNLKHKTCAFSIPYHSRTPTTLLPILLFEGQTGHSCATLRVTSSGHTFLLQKNPRIGLRTAVPKNVTRKRASAHYIILWALSNSNYGNKDTAFLCMYKTFPVPLHKIIIKTKDLRTWRIWTKTRLSALS